MTIKVSGSLWKVQLLHHNLGSKKNCDVTRSHHNSSFYRQSFGGCASDARLQPLRAQVFDFGLQENGHLLPRKEAAEDTISAACC